MFSKPDGVITVREFSAIIRMSDGGALVSPTDFQVIGEPIEINAKVIDRFTIEITEEIHAALKVGEEIVVIYDGFTNLNTIDKVGEGNSRYQVSEKLPVVTADTEITIRSNFTTIELQGIDLGFYYFQYGDRGNEQLIVEDTWMQPYIGYDVLTTTFPDAKTISDGRIKGLNEQAWEEIYCDFSSFGDAYHLLYGAEIRTLQKYKIFSILQHEYKLDIDKDFSQIYEKYLNKISMSSLKKLEADINGKPTGEILQLDMRFSL